MVTNENSQLVDAVHYFPFGEVWLEERPSSLPEEFFFTAKEFDPETGFYDFGARYLDPRFAKWMSADPALGKHLPGAGQTVAYQSPTLGNNWRTDLDLPGLGGAFQPMNLALYGYGHHNPATLLDPNGLDPDSPGFFRSTSPTMRSATSPSCRTMRSSLAASPAATSATPSAARGPRPITYDDLYGLISSTGIHNTTATGTTVPCRAGCAGTSAYGPRLPSWAFARDGSYRGISGRPARASITRSACAEAQHQKHHFDAERAPDG
jgi:RHS repeat-associated protein